MRARSRHRPLRRERVAADAERLERIRTAATYVGSPEHKDTPSFVGAARPRSDASMCPRGLAQERDRVEAWLKEAIRDGNIGGPWEGNFPRYVWYRDTDGSVYEARLVNQGNAEYKGYPLEPDEYPTWLRQ